MIHNASSTTQVSSGQDWALALKNRVSCSVAKPLPCATMTKPGRSPKLIKGACMLSASRPSPRSAMIVGRGLAIAQATLSTSGKPASTVKGRTNKAPSQIVRPAKNSDGAGQSRVVSRPLSNCAANPASQSRPSSPNCASHRTGPSTPKVGEQRSQHEQRHDPQRG